MRFRSYLHNMPAKHIKRATDTFLEILGLYTLVVILSGLAFAWFEGKEIGDSIWWACVTATTVGYGDISPVTLGGRIIAIGLMHIVPFIVAPLLIVRLTSRLIENEHEFTHIEQEKILADLDAIKKKLEIE